MSYKIAYSKINNAGDLFNENIMDYFGKQYKKTSILSADLVMLGGMLSTLCLSKDLKMRLKQRAGSLICNTGKPLHVFGTGFLTDKVDGVYLRKNLNIHALRGKLTREKLQKDIGYEGSPVLADPGLLASEFVKNRAAGKHEIGFIPHFRELDLPVVKKIIDDDPHIYFIDITQPFQKVIEEIAGCEMIISSSLHGLIFADSLKIPNKHLKISGRIKGDLFKFRDYYSAFDLEDDPFAAGEGKIPSANEIADSYKIDPSKVDKKIEGLIKAFPRDL